LYFLPTGTLAGAVEVLIKLIWDEETPPFMPHNSVLHTIVWTLVCALDGVMWAGKHSQISARLRNHDFVMTHK